MKAHCENVCWKRGIISFILFKLIIKGWKAEKTRGATRNWGMETSSYFFPCKYWVHLVTVPSRTVVAGPAVGWSVALCVPVTQGRTDGQCQHRWQKVLNPELVKGPWTKEEDQKVRRAGSVSFGQMTEEKNDRGKEENPGVCTGGNTGDTKSNATFSFNLTWFCKCANFILVLFLLVCVCNTPKQTFCSFRVECVFVWALHSSTVA